MHSWGLLLLSWLIPMTLGQGSDRLALRKHCAGWMELPPLPLEQRSPMERHGNHQARASTAKFGFGEFDFISRFLVPLGRPHQRFLRNRTLAVMPEHWSIPQPRAPRAHGWPLHPGRQRQRQRRSSWICSRWTKDAGFRWLLECTTEVPLFQDRPSLTSDRHTSSPSGALHPARCWRFTSARCCAPSERRAHVGLQWRGLSFQCATSLSLSRHNPPPQPCTQVLPPSPHAAASWAYLHCPGVHPFLGRLAIDCFSSGGKLTVHFPTWQLLFTELVTQPWQHAHLLSVIATGSRTTTKQVQCTEVGFQTLTSDDGLPPPQHSRAFQASPGSWGPRFISIDSWTGRVWTSRGCTPELRVHGLTICVEQTGASDYSMGKRGRRGGRRRRPRDSEREARRPPKRVRAAGADGDADSSSYESSGGPDISTEVGTESTRPLTVFSVGHATATATTRSTAAGGTLAQAARGADVEVVRPSGSSVSAQDNFCSDALRQEMAPDEFMAMASLMGRDYAVPKRATQALPSSSVAAPPASAQSGPAHARAPTSTPSSTSLGSSPVKRRFTERHWPAGALPPRRPASIGPAADEATARISERTRAPDKPVGSASVPSSSPTTADGGLLGRRATSPSTLRPSTIAYAKPRPKVRARDRVPTGQTTADGVLDPATPAAARVPSEPQPEQSRMDPCPSTDVPRPDSQGSPGTRQGGEVHDVSTEQAAGSESPAKTSSAAASLADIAPVHVREETRRRLGTEVMDSSSEEEADHELIRLRRRGDLPVKISAVTGLPSGVASLRRDPITGRIRVLRPAGFSLAHKGFTLAVDDTTVVFLDELSGFERQPDVRQPYMRGWDDLSFAFWSARLEYTPAFCHALTVTFRLSVPSARVPSISRPSSQTPAILPLSAHRACGLMPDRIPRAPRGRRCSFRSPLGRFWIYSPCIYHVGRAGITADWYFRGGSPTSDLVLLVSSCAPQLMCCSHHNQCLVHLASCSSCAPAGTSPGCPVQHQPCREPLRHSVQPFCMHSSGCYYPSGGDGQWPIWGIISCHFPRYIPTLLKPRRFCRHPWARTPGYTRTAPARGAACRRPINIPLRPQCVSRSCTTLAPIVFGSWDLWHACSQLLVANLAGNMHRRTMLYGLPASHFLGLRLSPRHMSPSSMQCGICTSGTPQAGTPITHTSRQGIHHYAEGTSHLPHRKQGSPGPKSGRCSSFACCRPLSSLGLLLLHIQAARATTTSDARVPLASQVSGEAGSAPPAPRQAPAKPLGTQDATCRSPLPSMQRQKIVKRSLQRVHRRILRTGGAWYKGKWYNQDTASALTNRLYQQQTPASGTPAPHDSRANSRAQVHSVTTHLPSQSPRHLQVYTWNVGGLGGGLYDEILYYIHRHPVDVLVIQETKWRFTSRWDTHQYFFVHSGSSAADFKQGGLLTIVAKRLVDPGTLRYVDPLPGRLLRVQFYRHSQPCDVLNFYQHTWKATDHIRRLRTQALDHLTRTIHMIPKRSLMIIGGDFNATCVHSAPHVGRCVMERSQLWATDQEDLQALILGLHLCALNTFQSQHPHHTYMWGTQQSQIDYLFVRCDMADGLSRQSYAMHDHPLGAWRGGARHFLVHSQIPTHWRPWSGHASPSVAPAVDRHAIADALSGKADPRIQAFRTDVQSALNPAPASISELHDTVHTLALKHFPKPVPVRGPRPWQDGTLQQYASRMWGHLRSLRKWAARKDAHSSLQALFQCWRHSTLHLRMHRDARQQGRELRKQRRLSLLSDADQAIRQGQSRQFYQLIDKLAPKGRFRKFQMCKGGDLLTPAEELEVMRKHFVQLFNHDRPGNSTLSSTSLAETADTSFQVCSHELQVYLDKLPARKAGAPSTAPGAVWRACSDLISPTLAGLLNQRWDHSPLTPPEPWVRATLSLLLKPHKSGSAPKDFRPIGLLDALGKASISMLMSKIRADLEAYIRTSPQFAYLTGRSTSDALRRVYVHNTAARAMRMPSTRDPHYKRAGGKPVTLQGALQVCLDLTSAFDFVPRHLIAEALQDAGITGAPAQLLLSWLHACSYDLYVEGKCAHIPTNRGVKQGCPASPLLFAAFMTLITRRLSSRLTPEWVAQYLTMFADDFHVGKCFYGYNELETLSAQIGFVITTLRKHGMSVHATKAQAILTVEGTQRSTVTQKLTRTTEDGRFLRVYTRAGDEFLPLVRKIDYLGAVTTYDSSASATLRRRTLLAKAAHSRLRSVLHAHRSLTVHHRVRLWRATVWPCLAYGLEVCGLTDEHHTQIQTLVMRHLRGIARSPAHITHESDTALAQRLGVPLPRTSLRRCFESAFGRQEPGDNYVLSFEHPWNQFLTQCLADPDPAPPPPGPTAPTPSQLPIVSVPEVAIAPAQDAPVDAARSSDHTIGSSVSVAPHSGTEVSSLPAVSSEPTPPVATLPAPVAGSGPFTCPQCQKVCDTRKTLKLHVSRVHKLSLPSHPFDRTLHSLQGMPTCALCLHPFTRWEVLEKHIKSWSCSAMPLPPSFAAQPPPPAQTDPTCLPNTAAVPDTATPHAPPCPTPPMSQTLSDVRPDTTVAPASATTFLSEVPLRSDEEAQLSTGLYDRVLSVWAGGGLQALLRHNITLELFHSCGVCGQWLASPTALKNHYHSLHATLFNRLAGQVDGMISRSGVAMNPCLYCQRTHRHPRQHIAHCVSLWQCCFLHTLFQHGDRGTELAGCGGGSRAAPILLRRGVGQQAERGGAGADAAGSGRSGPEDRSRSHRSGRLGQGLPGEGGSASSRRSPARTSHTQQRQSKLREWIHSGQRGCGIASSTSQSGGEARRHAQRAPAIHRMGVLDSFRGEFHPPHARGPGEDLVREGQQPRDPAESCESEGRPDVGHHDLSQRQADRSHPGSAGLRDSQHLGGHQRQLELSEVGCPPPDSHRGHHPTPAQHSTGAGELGGSSSGAQRRHVDQIRGHSGDSGRRPGQDHLQRGHQSPCAGVRGSLPGTGPPPGLGSVPDYRSPVQAGGLQSPPADSSDPPAGWLRQAILTNRTNVCYLNSVAFSLAWFIHCTPRWQSQLCPTGRLALTAVTTGPFPLNLLRCPPWQRLLQEWAQPTRQHDAAELLLHLSTLLGPQLFEGAWESRRQELNLIRALDGGSCAAAVTLELPGRNDNASLQQLLQSWHHQHAIHALLHPPQLLIIRLSRFVATRRSYRKHTGQVRWGSTVNVPFFADSTLRAQEIEYQILAVVCHRGPLATSGHYTAILHQPTQAWLCDDNTRPKPWPPDSSSQGQYSSSQAYLLICRRGGAAD